MPNRDSDPVGLLAKQILDSLPDAVIAHSCDGAVISWNRAAQEVFGYTEAHVTGATLQSLLSTLGASAERDHFALAAAGTQVGPYLARRAVKGGGLVDISVGWVPVLDEDGAIGGVCQIVRPMNIRATGPNSEPLAYAVVSSCEDALVVIDTEHSVRAWNSAAEALLGYSASEMIGAPASRMFDSETWEAVQSAISRVLAGAREPIRIVAGRRFDAAVVSLSIRWSPVRDVRGTLIAVSAVIRDVTEEIEHKHAEADVRADLERLLDQSPGAISYWNNDFTNRYANRAYARRFDTTPADMRGKHLSDIVGSTLFDQIRPSIEAALAGEPQVFESDFSLSDGNVMCDHIEYHSDGVGPLPGLFVFRYDVTGQRRIERQLNETLDQRRRLYESTPAMLHSIDAAGNIVEVSNMWLKKLGYSREEVIDRPSLDFLSLGSQKYARLVVLPQFRRDGEVTDIEYRMLRKDGSSIDVLLSAVSERDAKGRYVRSLAVIEDITERRRAEEALQASEAFVDRVGRVAGVGGWSLDLASQHLKWSAHTFRIHDLDTSHRPTVAEAIGYYAPDARPVIEAAVNACIEHGSAFDLELPLTTATGRHIWVRAVGEPVKGGGRVVGLIGAFQDITARRAVQNELRASRDALRVSETRLRLVVDNAPALIAYLDREERYQFHNGAYERWFGVSACSMHGQTVRETLGEAAYDELRPHIEQVLAGVPVQFERSVLTTTGPRWVEARYYPQVTDRGEVEGFHAFAWDRTDARQAQLRVAESEQRLMTIIANVPAMIGYVGMDGRFVFGNKIYANWFGVAPEALPGMTVAELLGPELYALSESYVTAALHGERQRFERAFHDVEGRDLKAHVEYLPDISNGVQRGMYTFAFDVTELNRLVNERTWELVEAKNTAEKANRVKDEIIANVSHEMRTPLHGIVGFASLGLSRLKPDSIDKCRTYFERIRSSGVRLTQFVDQILQLARLTSGELRPSFRPVNLLEVVNRVSADMQILFDDKELSYSCRCETGSVMLDAEAPLIERIVMNLLSNARKFSPAGGTVTVSVWTTTDATSTGHGGCVHLSVEDEGPGIPEAELELIFDPFVQSSRTQGGAGGTGLGLSIARRIAALHGGTLTAQNKAAGGAIFKLALPVVQSGCHENASAPSPATTERTEKGIPLAG